MDISRTVKLSKSSLQALYPFKFVPNANKEWHTNVVVLVFVTKIDSSLGVLQWAMLLLLCLCSQQLKTRHFHLIFLMSAIYSIWL